MMATMDAQGRITLAAETSVEAFALGQWIQAAKVTTWCDVPGMPSRTPETNWRYSMLLIDPSLPDKGDKP